MTSASWARAPVRGILSFTAVKRRTPLPGAGGAADSQSVSFHGGAWGLSKRGDGRGSTPPTTPGWQEPTSPQSLSGLVCPTDLIPPALPTSWLVRNTGDDVRAGPW